MKRTIRKKDELDMQKAQFVIPKDLHKRFKRVALDDDTTMSLIITELIEVYLEKREKELLK